MNLEHSSEKEHNSSSQKKKNSRSNKEKNSSSNKENNSSSESSDDSVSEHIMKSDYSERSGSYDNHQVPAIKKRLFINKMTLKCPLELFLVSKKDRISDDVTPVNHHLHLHYPQSSMLSSQSKGMNLKRLHLKILPNNLSDGKIKMDDVFEAINKAQEQLFQIKSGYGRLMRQYKIGIPQQTSHFHYPSHDFTEIIFQVKHVNRIFIGILAQTKYGPNKKKQKNKKKNK
ncbi:hypothetical protein VP01_2914g3 [Puccinia sorghi]|uniref:Uncharacterized protein n=1 Tax=Puccinia sorghi TaxID=27349 RepID=A0A0L6V1C0_9BASI|nr:hypothetical protein VP01_2914g3 [Puccinia sorghi]